MSNSQTSTNNRRFALVAVIVIIAGAVALAIFISPLASAGRGVVYHFAQVSFDRHNDKAALADLKYYQPATLASLNLQTKANLELANDQAAVTGAQQAHQFDPSDHTATLLLGAAYALSNQPVRLATLTATQKSSEVLQGLASLRMGNTARAQELYVLGLLRRSQTVLAQTQQASAQRSLLQAQVALGLQPGRAGALAAMPFAKAAVALDPTNLPAQELIVSVSRHTGDKATADQHQALVDRLKNGTP